MAAQSPTGSCDNISCSCHSALIQHAPPKHAAYDLNIGGIYFFVRVFLFVVAVDTDSVAWQAVKDFSA